MNNVVLTTKKTNLVYLICGSLLALVWAAAGFYFWSQRDEMIAARQFDSVKTLEIIAIMLFIFSVIDLLYVLLSSCSYANIYRDKIVGKGVQQLALKDFDLSFDRVTEISFSGRFLSIHTSTGKYKVVTSTARAKEIFNYYNSVKNGNW